MISTKVERKPENDNYRLLAFYVGAADHEEEKLLFCWHAGCHSEEFDLAIREVEAVQDMNTRTTKEKTYHLIVSFRPEDEAKLSQEVLQDIEKEFASVLGFEEHQRHCGVHKNTANIHLHVAYNMIHPEKYTRHEEYRDYFKRDALCRELERKYGLVVDVEELMQASKEPVRDNTKARTVEAYTGQQSFDGYLNERKQILLDFLEKSVTWQNFHALCATLGVIYTAQGNGCIFKDKHGKHAAKASSIDRQFSKGAMEKRFGLYEEALEKQDEVEAERYTARPLQKNPERNGLYEDFQRSLAARRSALEEIDADSKISAAEIHSKWGKYRRYIETKSGLTKADRMQLLMKNSQEEKEALQKLKQEMQSKRDAVRQATPYWNWAAYLQEKARTGDEMALAILRSRKEEVKSEAEPPRPTAVNPKTEALRTMRERWKEDREQTRCRSDLTKGDRKGLLTASRMYQLIAEDKLLHGDSALTGFTWTVDTKGTVLFRLPTGSLIHDTGTEISYSVSDPVAKAAALRLARLKFGRDILEKDNILQRMKGAGLEI